MPGWFNRAAACASRRKRSTKLASRANCGRSVLIATVRLRTRSWPRHTSAMPPAPSGASTSYRSPKIRSMCSLLALGLRPWPPSAGRLPEVRLDHRANDGCRHLSSGGLTAQVTAVEDDNRDGDSGRLLSPRRSERREPRVGRPPLAVRGGARLPRDLDPWDLREEPAALVHHR